MQKKSPENFEKSKTHKNNRQNSENDIFTKNETYVEKYTAGHLGTWYIHAVGGVTCQVRV